jgi:hypothetical protein
LFNFCIDQSLNLWKYKSIGWLLPRMQDRASIL